MAEALPHMTDNAALLARLPSIFFLLQWSSTCVGSNLHAPDLGAVRCSAVQCSAGTACRNQDVIRRVVLIDEAGSCGLCEATPTGIRLAGHWEAATVQYSDPLRQEQVQILQRWEEEGKEKKKKVI